MELSGYMSSSASRTPISARDSCAMLPANFRRSFRSSRPAKQRRGIDQRRREGGRFRRRRRLAKPADTEDFQRVFLVAVQDGLGNAHQMAGIPPHRHEAPPLLLGEGPTQALQVLQQPGGKGGDREAQMRGTDRRAQFLGVPFAGTANELPDLRVHQPYAYGERPPVGMRVHAAGHENLQHVTVVLLQPTHALVAQPPGEKETTSRCWWRTPPPAPRPPCRRESAACSGGTCGSQAGMRTGRASPAVRRSARRIP